MTITKEEIQAAIELRTKLEQFCKSLKPSLLIYSTHHHYSLGKVGAVDFDKDVVSFSTNGYCKGYFEEQFTVTWDFFDNPEDYIQKEEAAKEQAELDAVIKVNAQKEQQERETYKKLRAKFDEKTD